MDAIHTRDDILRKELANARQKAALAKSPEEKAAAFRLAAAVARARGDAAKGDQRAAWSRRADAFDARASAPDAPPTGSEPVTTEPDGSDETDLTKEALSFIEAADVSFADIAGMDDIVTQLRTAAFLMLARREADAPKLSAIRRMLLFGPPGTGKTLLAAATSHELGATFFNVDGRLERRYFGESPNLLHAIFELARARAPAVVFLDEVDHWGRQSEEGGQASLHNQLLVELDGLRSKGRDEGLVVLAATNRPGRLSPAIRARFQSRIFVDLPGPVARAAILDIILKKRKLALDGGSQWLVDATDGYSGRELEGIIDHAAMQMVIAQNPAIKTARDAKDMSKYMLRTTALAETQLREALARVKPATSPRARDAYKTFTEDVA